ncbi:type VI secretion system-associated FHA domain protein [Veronia pacifica]|uniref:FHA domain-containing protein n=1 Tax=Veronia pacifica TaxID=1080227 RepID=A0A1C3EDS3_9GAMM|nr:FHA domain-containing protein [Veronia pacifica]ODA31369.1 hypothetical protein A8L45_17425 [Veronia pacifica]
MPLSIRIISSPDGESITEWNTSFPDEGGDIGRAFGATMQLSDASREVSACHAKIRKSSRGYQIRDDSTNGLYINGANQPLGKGREAPLNDGDVLDIGRYRLLVSCFVPATAEARQSTALDPSLLGDDPFGSASPVESNVYKSGVYKSDVYKSNVDNESDGMAVPDFRVKAVDHVEADPFSSPEQEKKGQSHGMDFNFDALEDDPLAESGYPGALMLAQTTSPTASQDRPSDRGNPNPVSVAYAHQEQHINQALEMAITRLLSELAPDTVEPLFDDLSNRTFRFGRPNYWEIYKRYYQRQLDNRDWQVKFFAYFQDAMRVQHHLQES